MVDSRETQDLSRADRNVFAISVGIREPDMTVGKHHAYKRRMAVHDRLLTGPYLIRNTRTFSFSSSTV